MLQVGIMQGRLSPRVDERIQAFPKESWREEFEVAAECGFEIMEWVVDADKPESNPLFSNEDRKKINQLQKNNGIAIPSVCCDFFLQHPLQQEVSLSYASQRMLLELCRICPEVGIRMIEIPLIGKTGLRPKGAADRMTRVLDHITPILKASNVKILLETDLGPEQLLNFLNRIDNNRILVNYDIGNSAYWGFNAENEITLYGEYIGNIHIKDCTPEKYSVALGSGNVDFDNFFLNLREKDYNGDFILQTARGKDDIGLAKKYREYTLYYINKYLV